jgi:hypothetical protein
MDMSFTDLDDYYYYHYNVVVVYIGHEDLICSCRQCAVACEAYLTLHVT